LGDGAEALLASGVPLGEIYDLELDLLAVYFNRFDFKVNANGREMRSGERIIREAEQEACLPHS
jgi:hypothetical protein